MDIEIKNHEKGILLAIANRVDAFTFDDAKKKISEATKVSGRPVAIDLSRTTFLSLSSIRLLYSLAIELQKKGGFLALIAPTEKLKRQIDIYASLDPMRVFSSGQEWEQFNSSGPKLNR